MNYLVITGNLGGDPELKFSQTQTAISSFSLAVGQRSKVAGEWVDGETMWFRVTFFGAPAEKIVDRYKKGDTVTVSGRLGQSTYTAKDKTVKTSTDIVGFDILKVERAPAKGKTDTGAPF
jgi:single-strand DNA-binding protein